VKGRKRRNVLQSARTDGDEMRRPPGHLFHVRIESFLLHRAAHSLIAGAGREDVMRNGRRRGDEKRGPFRVGVGDLLHRVGCHKSHLDPRLQRPFARHRPHQVGPSHHAGSRQPTQASVSLTRLLHRARIASRIGIPVSTTHCITGATVDALAMSLPST
jgi:hypothetical protein